MYEDEQTISPRKSLGFAAAWAAGLSLLCVFVGEGAQQLADSLGSSPIEIAGPSGKKPVFNAIDYATTGATKGQTVILSPCVR